jgi:hypothetical protein
MREVWQIVRIELQRKWPFAAVLLALWFFVGLAVWVGLRSMYGPGPVTGEEAGPIMSLFPLVYALIFGATLFHTGEKDGVRFFLYHHPVPRVHIYLVRYLTGMAVVAFLSAVTILLTLFLFPAWPSKMTPGVQWAPIGYLDIPSGCLLVYATSAFLSPLFATDLITVPLAAVYSIIAAIGLGCLNVTFFEPHGSVEPALTLLVGGLVVFLCLWRLFSSRQVLDSFIAAGLVLFGASLVYRDGDQKLALIWIVGSLLLYAGGSRLFSRRRILEYSWRRRSALAAALFVCTCLALLALTVVDFVDLLYLMGIDLMKL